MESVKSTWELEFSSLKLEGFENEPPIQGPFNVVLTDQRIIVTSGTAKPVDVTGKRSDMWIMTGGLAGALLKGPAEKAMGRRRERKFGNAIDPSGLEQSLSAGDLVYGMVSDIQCEIIEPEKVWFTSGTPMVIFFGSMHYRDQVLKGVIVCWRDGKVEALQSEVRQSCGLQAKVIPKKSAPKDEQLDSYIEDLLNA